MADRLADDAYYTPQPLATAIVARLAVLDEVKPRRVLEPSAGLGAFVHAARHQRGWERVQVCSLDVREEVSTRCARAGSHSHRTMSFLDLGGDRLSRFDLVLGNPPYSLAEEFIRHALKHVLPGAHVAFLLRMSFLGSRSRLLGVHRDLPARWILPIAGRPSFTPDGKTDASEYAMFVWTREWFDYPVVLDAVEWTRSAE